MHGARTRAGWIVVGAAAGLVVAGGAAAVAAPSPGPTPTTKAQHHRGAVFHRAQHAEAYLGKGAGQRIAVEQRGVVTATSGGTVTVRSADGFTATWATSAATKVRKGKVPSTVGAVAVKDRVLLVGRRTGSTRTARVIGDRGAA